MVWAAPIGRVEDLGCFLRSVPCCRGRSRAWCNDDGLNGDGPRNVDVDVDVDVRSRADEWRLWEERDASEEPPELVRALPPPCLVGSIHGREARLWRLVTFTGRFSEKLELLWVESVPLLCSRLSLC